MDITQIVHEVNRVTALLLRTEPDRRKQVFDQQVAQINDQGFTDILTAATSLLIIMDNNEEKFATLREHTKRYTLLSGVIMTLVIVVIAFLLPNPTPFQEGFFRIVLAGSVGVFASFCTGMIRINGNMFGMKYRAMGGFAVFFIIYFWNPASFLATGKLPPSNITANVVK